MFLSTPPQSDFASFASGHLSTGADEQLAHHFDSSFLSEGDTLPSHAPDACSTREALLLEALSDRLLHHLPRDVWRQLFCGRDPRAVQFEARDLTVLHAPWESSVPAHKDADLEWLAQCHHGRLEPSPAGSAMVSFARPQDALRMALNFYRIARGPQPGIGLAGGECIQGVFWAEGVRRVVALGRQVRRAEAMAQAAPGGSIMVCGRTHGRLRSRLETEARGCLVIEEFEQDRLLHASITPPPQHGAHSSFAGLGLTVS